MPFIVSLYKYIILAFCFLVLIGVALVVFAALDPSSAIAGIERPTMLASAAAFLVFFVLNLGAIAILISLHDRHREVAEGMHRIAEALEERNAARL